MPQAPWTRRPGECVPSSGAKPVSYSEKLQSSRPEKCAAIGSEPLNGVGNAGGKNRVRSLNVGNENFFPPPSMQVIRGGAKSMNAIPTAVPMQLDGHRPRVSRMSSRQTLWRSKFALRDFAGPAAVVKPLVGERKRVLEGWTPQALRRGGGCRIGICSIYSRSGGPGSLLLRSDTGLVVRLLLGGKFHGQDARQQPELAEPLPKILFADSAFLCFVVYMATTFLIEKGFRLILTILRRDVPICRLLLQHLRALGACAARGAQTDPARGRKSSGGGRGSSVQRRTC